MKALSLIVLAGCLDSTSVVCGADMICPDDQVCAHVTDPDQDLCADPGQLQACEGRATYTHCGANGRCYEGVCLPVACGNGRIDRPDPSDPNDDGEVCDDGNERSGDGCSSDCRSTETCGNNAIDPIKLERCDDGDQISNDGCDSTCQPERAHWDLIAFSPQQQAAEMFSYDLMRDRLVMFGGSVGDAMTNETWEGSTSGLSRVTTAQSPSPRFGATMVYDVARRETVLFGGGGTGETWIWDGANWAERGVVDGPSPRDAHAMAYDARRARTVLFGGVPDGLKGPAHDTWEWDGSTWTQIMTATSPIARRDHAMVYDPRRGVVVMWGGSTDDRSVWEYDGTDWREVPADGPHPREHPSLAYDPVTGRVLLVSGDHLGAEIGDVWTWDGSAWQQLQDLDPPIVPGHVMTTDLRRGSPILLGHPYSEFSPAGGPLSTWTWDGASWSARAVDDGRSVNVAQTAALDPLRAAIVVLGLVGTGEFGGAGWTKGGVDPAGNNRQATRSAYDAVRRSTILFGGAIAGADALMFTCDDTWMWMPDTASWSQLHPATTPPPRAREGLAFDAKTARITMFGGATCVGTLACDVLDDTWEWDGDDWRLANPGHRPPGRQGAAVAYDPIRQQIVMFGGGVPSTTDPDQALALLEDTWTWNGMDWTEQHPADRPSARVGASMAWDAKRGRLVLYGGTTSLSYATSDVWEWDGATWAREAVTNSPIRTGHAMASAVAGGVTMIGGSTSLGTPADGAWLLRWDGTSPTEACRSAIDGDGDGLAGCADPDCWWACAPLCPPGAPCDPASPRCGDGVCNDALEDGWICPADCTRPVICGDAICDPGETACPGDCP